MTGPDYKFMMVNRKFCEITGYSTEELLGKTFAFITPPEKQGRDLEGIKKVESGEEECYLAEKQYLRKDRTLIWASVRLSAVWEKGYLKNFLCVAEDISDRKRAEEELDAVLEELKRSNSDLEQFAYVSSHDLQEPLRSITGYLQLMERKYKGRLDADADEFIKNTVAAAERMKAIISDILEYSRIDRKGGNLELFSAKEALDQAVLNLESTIAESKAEVIYGGMPEIYGDPGQITRLFQNLIGNALKFRGATPPAIRISAFRADAETVFCVEDNGIGIEPQYYEKVFAIFQRLHSRREYPGTGIGLSICKKIVERHGGRIWVESVYTKGTKFFFTISDRRHK